MRFAYHAVQSLGLAVAAPYVIWRLARGHKRQADLARLGFRLDEIPRLPGCVWVHALSVGEVRSALPLLKGLGKRFPERPLLLTTATGHGFETAQELARGLTGVTVARRPLDLPWVVGPVLDRLRPALAILVEGDIWPGWQLGLAEAGVPRMLVNCRLSPRSFRRWRMAGPLARVLLGGFERILAQTHLDLERLLALGLPPERVVLSGNLKFDSAPAALCPRDRQELAAELGLAGRTLVVAGSTHQGEEEPILEAFAILARRHPDLGLILAPREVERGGQVARLARERGLSAARFSRRPAQPGDQVLVLDVLGRLAQAYALGRAAFVGGSWVTVGGHNLLEPAAQGTPVAFGPVMHNFQEMSHLLAEAGGGAQVADGQALVELWGLWLDHPDQARATGQAGQEFCRQHRGAVARALEQAQALLEPGR